MTSARMEVRSVVELQLALRAVAAAQLGCDVDFVVVGAEPGVGCSVTALLLADAIASSGRQVHLRELALRSCSALVAAATVELGAVEGGRWMRGRRGGVTIWRRADDLPGGGNPPQPRPGAFSIVDAGHADGARRSNSPTLLVFRATGPGLRAAETALDQVTGGPVAVAAALGPRRWPPSVRASCGPSLTRLLDAGRVVRVPLHHRLAVDGLTSAALPRPLLAAGGRLARVAALVELPRAQGAR